MKRVFMVLEISVLVVYAVIIILLIPTAIVIGPIVETLFIKRDLSIFADALTFVLVFCAGSLLVVLPLILLDRILNPKTKKLLRAIVGYVILFGAIWFDVKTIDEYHMFEQLFTMSLITLFAWSMWMELTNRKFPKSVDNE